MCVSWRIQGAFTVMALPKGMQEPVWPNPND